MATKLSVISVGCMAIGASYHALILQIAYSLNAGATSVIGNVIGEGDSRLSKMIAIVAYVEGLAIYLVIALLTFTYSREIAGMYTDDKDTAMIMSKVLEALSPSLFFLSQVLCL